MHTVVTYFGERWDAGLFDGPSQQVETPVGQLCGRCQERVEAGDRGLLRVGIVHQDGLDAYEVVPIHTECDMLGALGHDCGVCHCSGWDTTSRAAALELLARINFARQMRGQPPL